MKKWSVCILVDATTNGEVEAESAEQAKELAMQQVEVHGLCHRCSDHLEVGDAIEAVEAYEVAE